MITMKKIILLLAFTTAVYAQTNSGGLANLKFGFSARDISMGDFGAASSKGASAFHYNPSLLTGSTGIIVSHNEYIQDVSGEYLGIGFSLFDLPFAIGVSTTTIPNIEIREKPGEALGKFNAHYFYGGLSTAFNLYGKLRSGITFKYLYEGLFSDEATGYAFDFGFTYADFLTHNLRLGLSLKNFGSMNQLRNQSTKLPSEIRFGANYSMPLEKLKSEIAVTAGVQKYFEENETHLHAGAEIIYSRTFALRLGYITGYESKGFSAGLGVRWNSFNFDYAYVPFSFDLGNSNFVSVSYNFN